MSLHIIKGTAAPTTTPSEIGQHFVDTTSGQQYLSTGTNSSTDWKRVDNDGAGVTTFLGLTDTPVNYVGSAGKVATVNPGETALVFEEGQSPLAEMSLSTSNLIGCEITINADNTLFDMAEGTGIHVDNTTTPGTPVITVVNVPERLAQTVTNIGTQPSTAISIDGSGNIIQAAAPNTPSQRRDRFSVGVLIHTSLATIDDIAIAWVPGYDIKGQLHDLMDAIGFFITGGNIVSGVTSTLSFQKSSGTGFAPGINVDVNTKDPNSVVLPIQNPVTFFTIKQDGVVTGVSTFLDPTVYDNAGVITTVPSNNNATIKYIYLFATGAMSVLQGQEVFSTFAAAVDASGGETVVVPGILGTGILMARVIMTKTSTDTTDTSVVRFVASSSIASGGGGGAATTMQGSYDISVQPQVTLNGSGGIQYRDASTPIGTFLFKVSNNADTTDFITVDVGGVKGSELTSDGLNPNTAVAGDGSGKLISSATTTIELGYLAGATSNIQAQIDATPDNFLELDDTPSSYETPDQAGRFVSINAAGDGLEFSGGVLWTPADLTTEAEGWWDASDTASITEVGNDVSQIDDQTSNANHLVQGTGSEQPETGQTLNGLNVLTFDSTTFETLERVGFSVPVSGDISIFTVQSFTSSSGSNASSLFSLSDNSDFQFQAQSLTQFDGQITSSNLGGSGSQTLTGGPFNGPSMYNAFFDKTGNGRGVYVDGVERTTSEVYTTALGTSQTLRIMANRGDVQHISGIMAEMVIVEDQSLETRQLIEGYLNHKWNLPSLPSGHPYEFFAPTVAVGAGGGFTNLKETPSTLGTPGQLVEVNAAGDKLDFINPPKAPSTAALTPTTGAVALDWTAATVFTHAISGNSTFTISNQVAGESIGIVLTSSGAFTPTFTGVLWAGGIAPGAMASSDVWSVTLIYDGTNTLGVFQEGFA